jgi:hypothetical protein
MGTYIIGYGLACLAVGTVLDLRGFRRHAFWMHLFAAIGVLSGIGFRFSSDLAPRNYGWALIVTACGFLVASEFLGRIAYAVFGALSLVLGVGVLYPRALVLTGLGIILIAAAAVGSLRGHGLTEHLSRLGRPAPQRD